MPAPGSQAIIQCLPRLLTPTRVAVITPTYREHVTCWSAAAHHVLEVRGPEEIAEDTGVVVIADPNNPDGRLFNPELLLGLGGKRLLIVDEAFADVVPEHQPCLQAGRPNLIILRSFGKFFGLAGMRLGFALTGRAPLDRCAARSALGRSVGRRPLSARWHLRTMLGYAPRGSA